MVKMKLLNYNAHIIAVECELIGLYFEYFTFIAASISDVILATSFSRHHVITSRFKFSCNLNYELLFATSWIQIFHVMKKNIRIFESRVDLYVNNWTHAVNYFRCFQKYELNGGWARLKKWEGDCWKDGPTLRNYLLIIWICYCTNISHICQNYYQLSWCRNFPCLFIRSSRGVESVGGWNRIIVCVCVVCVWGGVE